MAAAHQTRTANRYRAGHQAAAAPDGRELYAGRGRHHEALAEFGAAEDLASQLAGSQALASQMSVSVNTVSAHIRSIYTKLGVRDRSAAVRRARDLRLLAADRTR